MCWWRRFREWRMIIAHNRAVLRLLDIWKWAYVFREYPEIRNEEYWNNKLYPAKQAVKRLRKRGLPNDQYESLLRLWKRVYNCATTRYDDIPPPPVMANDPTLMEDIGKYYWDVTR